MPRSLRHASSAAGRQEQIPHQWTQRTRCGGSESLSLGAIECQQPTLSHHAGTHHQSLEHEITRNPRHGGRSHVGRHVRNQTCGGAQNNRKEASQSGRNQCGAGRRNTPTLERLRVEKQNYLKWTKNSADLERLDRFCIAHQFQQAQKALEQEFGGRDGDAQEKVKSLEADVENYREQIDAKEAEIEDASSKLKGEMDNRHATVKKAEQERSNELVRITSKWTNSKETVAKAEADLQSAKQLVEETQAAVATKEQDIATETAAAKDTVQAAADAESTLERLTTEYQTMSAGMSESTENRTLPEQISQAHTPIPRRRKPKLRRPPSNSSILAKS